jgi:hypothetical protein
MEIEGQSFMKLLVATAVVAAGTYIGLLVFNKHQDWCTNQSQVAAAS